MKNHGSNAIKGQQKNNSSSIPPIPPPYRQRTSDQPNDSNFFSNFRRHINDELEDFKRR